MYTVKQTGFLNGLIGMGFHALNIYLFILTIYTLKCTGIIHIYVCVTVTSIMLLTCLNVTV